MAKWHAERPGVYRHFHKAMRLKKASELVSVGIEETLVHYQYLREHWRRIRTNNPMERIVREIRPRTRVVGNFPDGESALMLVAARVRRIAGTKWRNPNYLNMDQLKELETELKVIRHGGRINRCSKNNYRLINHETWGGNKRTQSLLSIGFRAIAILV